MHLRYLDVCSGISAPTQAWKPLGWECAGYFEIDPFACEVLAAHYPDVSNYGDLLKVDHDELKRKVGRIDVVVGGTPCQGFSVAGKRGGLDDPRSNLLFAHFALARAVGARWVVWENVPGVLSDDGGRTFKLILRTLLDLGYQCAWRVLDARFFGVPQRRRRMFVVGYLGDWRPPAAVLFEPESLRRDSQARGAARAGVASRLANGSGGSGYRCDGDTETLIPETAGTLGGGSGARGWADDLDRMTFVPQAFQCHGTNVGPMGALRAGNGNTAGGVPFIPQFADPISAHEGRTYTQEGSHNFRLHNCVPFQATPIDLSKIREDVRTGAGTPATGVGEPGDPAYTLGVQTAVQAVAYALGSHAGAAEGDACNESHDSGGPVGSGVSEDGTGRGTPIVSQPFVFQPRLARCGRGAPEDVSAPLTAQAGRTGKGDSAQAVVQPTGGEDGFLFEAYPVALLRGVRETYGAEALSRWGLGVLEQLLSSEVLRSALHGSELRPAAFSRGRLVNYALSRAEDRACWVVLSLREACGEGHPSQGWEPSEQRAEQLGAYLSELSQPGPQAEKFMHALWQASEGLGPLRQALSAIQEARRSPPHEAKSASAAVMVRRLTPTECEFLQGMPRNYTLIDRKGKPAADGPRYKALGNSMAVPVMRWIGERIANVDDQLVRWWMVPEWRP